MASSDAVKVVIPETGTAQAGANTVLPKTEMPLTGAMATNPALTVGGIMAVVAFIFNFLVAQGIIGPPTPELQALFDEHGVAIAGAAIAAWGLIQGWITRNKVIAPATLARLVPSLVRRG
jgi:hypothetical protein